MQTDPVLSDDSRLAERRARARQQQIYRRRRIVAVAVTIVALLVLIGAIAALFSGCGTKSDAVKKIAPVAAPVVPTAPKTASEKQAAAVDQTLERMPLVAVAGRRVRDIALTFDDGPGPYTLQVAKVLERYKVPATFFQVGQAVKVFTDAEGAQLRDDEFVLGDHTETHPRMSALSREAQAAEIDDAAAVIKAAGGKTPQLFRPPFGAFDRTTLSLLAQRRMLMIFWTVDSQDYTRPGVPVIVKRVVDGARPGAIVLMHDAGGARSQTVAALPLIIKQLRAKHYHLVTVPRLLLDDPPPLKQPPITVGVG